MEYVLGVDVGTSSCKATLLRVDGLSVTASSDDYALITPRPDWAEQDPADWRHGVAQAIRRSCAAAEATAREIAAVGFSGQMHTAVLLDSASEVIRPPLLWCDQRPTAEAEGANASMPSILDITLNRLLPAFTLSKILWTKAHEPEAFARIRHVVLPKDLVRLWLTGGLATEPSDAAGTGLFDSRHRAWSSEIANAFDVPMSWLPEVTKSDAIVGSVRQDLATEFGLLAGTPVVAGGGDQAAQALGLRAVDGRVLALQIGTSGVIVLGTVEPVLGAFCHVVEDRWIRLDSMHAAGSSVLWLRDAIAPGGHAADLLERATAAPGGADDPTFLPFLTGERTGFGRSVPAAFVGLQLHHGQEHLVRAVLEGIALELRRMFERWSIGQGGPDEIRVVGGGARSALQLQILADAFDLPVTRLERDSSYGAAVLAGMGIGWWGRPPEPSGVTPVRPDAVGVEKTAEAYARFLDYYEALSPR